MGTDTTLTPDDTAFLRRPLHGFLTVAAGPIPPQPRPVWFELAGDGTVHIFTERSSAKLRRLRTDPRASLVVAAPVGEPERWVSVAGRVTVEPDGARDLCDRLAARYWDLTDPARAAALATMRASDLVRLVLHVEKVARVG
ncbi:pyridoxamine 5'-phosphate oxidase family protein [Nocardia harenae]|uniref:pyridoxamine 5'-phosphate oxidase family protein n=1 Tax=Nocardia harenae TaxID=358707 RepID=UPI000832A6DA|nr:pyridoxamine 5'-phosphate oxidase family protein [Nocardia harenae]